MESASPKCHIDLTAPYQQDYLTDLYERAVFVKNVQAKSLYVPSGLAGGTDVSDGDFGPDRIADPHRAFEFPIDAEHSDDAFTENAGLRQKPRRHRHDERTVSDSAPERTGLCEHFVNMDRREIPDEAGE